MEYLEKSTVEALLKEVGTGPFTVAFDKKDGGHRIMTGVLKFPIEGELEDTVVMMVDEGVRSFNAHRVNQLGAITDENLQIEDKTK